MKGTADMDAYRTLATLFRTQADALLPEIQDLSFFLLGASETSKKYIGLLDLRGDRKLHRMLWAQRRMLLSNAADFDTLVEA